MIVKNQDKECKRVNDDEKETLRKYYLDNEMSELKKIANPIIKQRNFPMMEHDDLYSDAMKVLRVMTKTEIVHLKHFLLGISNVHFMITEKRAINGNDVILKLKTAY